MATITAAARTMHAYDALPADVGARAKEQLDKPDQDFEAAGTIEGAVVVFAHGQRRDLR
jgi:hypothetical protein